MNLLNFRDLGGIKTICGRKIRGKRLLRSAQPVGLLKTDIEKLREHDLKMIIDFRTMWEVTAEPVDEIADVTYTHLDIMGENSAQAADPRYWVGVFQKDPASVITEFTKTYQEFATSPSSMAGYSAFIKACIAAREGAVLFHCAAGKDRTGFAAALLLKILGVADEGIFEDYMQTKIYQDERRDFHTLNAKKQGFTDEQIAAMEEVFGIQTNYLTAAIKAAEEKFGSFENYVAQGLGLTPDDIELLKDNYLYSH